MAMTGAAGMAGMCALAAPLAAAMPDTPQSVYALPRDLPESEGANSGGVNLDFNLNYTTAYVYRGIDHNRVGSKGSSPNLQFDGAVRFDLGNFPHPFVGLFSDIFDTDPVSRFQEIRPTFGFDWELKPITFTAGHNTYIYPERERLNTAEVYGQITLDDSTIFSSDQPVFSPYLSAAYDYDINNGWYFEAGVKHDFVVEGTGLTITPKFDVAYLSGIQQQFVFFNTRDTGFHHYDVGLNVEYSLNTLLNVSRRYGEWSLRGFLFYSGTLNEKINADNTLWGGGGIRFTY